MNTTTQHCLFAARFSGSLPCLWVGLVFLLPLLLGGCASNQPASTPKFTVNPPGPGDFSEDDLAALQAVFAHLISMEPEGETVFMALTPINPSSSAPVDPPAELLAAARELPLRVKPASRSRLTLEPVLDPDRPERFVMDPQTGMASTIYWVNIAGRPEKNVLKIEAGGFRGPRESWGFLARVEKLAGRWYITRQDGQWSL